VFLIGAVFVLAAIVEWMIQGWSERASGDTDYNAQVRKRLLHPLEFPALASLGIAVVVFSFSRIMLFLSKTEGPVVFVVVAVLIMIGGFLFAARPTLKKGLVAGVCSIAALGLISTGAVMAIDGARHIEPHEIIAKDPSICASNTATEADDHSSQGLAAKSNTAATIVFEDGKLYALVIGQTAPAQSITLPRGNPSNIVFKNLDPEEVRLTVNLGTFEEDVNGTKVTKKPITCTALVEQGGRQFLTLRMPKSSIASSTPYTFTVPGVDGSSVEIVVP